MRKKLFMKKSLVFLLFFPLIFFFHCGGKRTTRPTKPEYKFTINGVVVKDLNLGKDIAYFTILRDSVLFDSAVVKVGLDTLENQGGGAYYKKAPQLFNFGQNVFITVSCAEDSFSLDTSVVMPDSFYIDELSSDDTLNSGGHPVSVKWRPSIHASGYFLSVVKPDTTPGLVGYTTLDEFNNRRETIPREAFRIGEETVIYGIYEV
ncbi:MAG: hypothetical protein ACE5KJ_04555, partial [Candidatus Zixiibacteriota bacterium]